MKTMLAAALAAALTTAAVAENRMMPMAEFTPETVKWGAAPEGLPEGAQGALLAGDPSKKGGMFTVRLKAPAGYKIMPHTHPSAEDVTVLEGTLYLGMGETFDEAQAKAYPAGSYLSIPTGHKHYAWFKDGGTVQVSALGPWGITYVNPQDDPRKTSKGR